MAKYQESKTFIVGQSETTAITMNERALTGLVVSGNVISGSLISFLVSNDGTNYYPLLDNNSTEISLVVSTTPKAYALSPELFLAWDFIKARLGTSSSAVNQASANEGIILILDSM
jgi:hypothetical protein